MKRTSRELKATRSRKGAALQQAGLLRTQIEQRRELLEALQEESVRNTERLFRDSMAITSLTDDLEGIVQEYSNTLRAANRARLTDSWTVFLFNSKGINDVFRRTIYLRQYRQFRTRQAELIRRTKSSLTTRMEHLLSEKSLRDSLLYVTEEQGALLETEMAIQNQIVSTLSASERGLLKKVQQQQKEATNLKRRINKAIAAEISRKARKPTPTASAGGATAKPSDVGGAIANRRGRLGWPVQGKVTGKFGNQPHPEYPSLKIDNSGINIAGGKHAKVVAVFAGNVVQVTRTSGKRYTVLVSHGKYFTVYSNLEFPQIKAKETVKAGDQIGLTAANGDALNFQLWKGKVAQDPQKWLK